MPIYTLYVKTHNETGLKYLGQTRRDPFKYKGSGTWWSYHLKKHGNNHSTEILALCKTKEELATCGIFFSKLFNVVESKEWANLEIEDGRGGSVKGKKKNYPKNRKSHTCSLETKEKMRHSYWTKTYPIRPNARKAA
jgi:hypothetical protein